MQFTGEVMIPDVDHPGVPAKFLIEGEQAELVLDGESLGRWSLFDVHAARLIASAFQVTLGEDEITWVADDPIDFAYRGVEHMAETWARFKAMTIPRRVVAVKMSRRGTTDSRIPDLREAMLTNLGQPSAPSIADRIESVTSSIAPVDDPDVHDTVATPEARRPESEEAIEPPAQTESAVPTLEPASTASQAEEDEVVPEPVTRPRLVPGPGLVGSASRPRPASGDQDVGPEPVGSPAVDEPVEPAVVEPVEVPVVDEPVEPAVVEPVEAPVVDEPVEPAVVEPVEAPVEPVAEAPEIDEEHPEVPDEVGELIGTSSSDGGGAARELVVDLGQFEEGSSNGAKSPSRPVTPDEDPAPEVPAAPGQAEREPVLVGEPGEKSSLLGAVRSAFVRNRATDHEHEFVEAPGGIGLTRRICADCGHISIGTDD